MSKGYCIIITITAPTFLIILYYYLSFIENGVYNIMYLIVFKFLKKKKPPAARFILMIVLAF